MFPCILHFSLDVAAAYGDHIPMYIETVPNRGSHPTILLREGRRVGGKVVKKTLANLTKWPGDQIEALRLVLKGEKLVPARESFFIERSLPHGHVEAVTGMMRRLGLENIISSTPGRERDLVMAMIAQRVIRPSSKLGTTQLWEQTTLGQDLAVGGADVDELYKALDWLLGRQQRIENKLARLHLKQGGLALYDVSSSTYEGRTCPLARFGHNRDGKKGKRCVVYGMTTNDEGCPVAVNAYPGNTGDPATVPDQVETLRKRFDLGRVVLVGDRGMLTGARIEAIRRYPGLGWISALRSEAIRRLADQEVVQMTLFDEQNLAEITSPDFPGERLVACFNPELAEERGRKREELLKATETSLMKIARQVARRTRTPMSGEEIALRVGKVIARHKMRKHFNLEIADGRFTFERDASSIEREASLDGIYVIRTSEAKEDQSAAQTVRNYKRLAHVERAFRTMKGPDIRIRPIFHRTEDHVRAHIFLCLLAYYVEWHMRRAWKELLYDDEELETNRDRRDPVLPAEPSVSARAKKIHRLSESGLPIHSFDRLLSDLATRCRNRCRFTSVGSGAVPATFERTTEATPLQARALELLGLFPEGQKTNST